MEITGMKLLVTETFHARYWSTTAEPKSQEAKLGTEALCQVMWLENDVVYW